MEKDIRRERESHVRLRESYTHKTPACKVAYGFKYPSDYFIGSVCVLNYFNNRNLFTKEFKNVAGWYLISQKA